MRTLSNMEVILLLSSVKHMLKTMPIDRSSEVSQTLITEEMKLSEIGKHKLGDEDLIEIYKDLYSEIAKDFDSTR